jgi:DNA polymerase-3 subunit alpha
MSKFVHLRVHSEYSLIDGIVRVKSLVNAAKAAQMPAVALTDQSNLCALVKFYKAATQAGIKPIIGADIWVEREDKPQQPWRMTLLAQNEKGYGRLRELLSMGYQLNQVHEVPILKPEWILQDNEGLIALSGGKEGHVGSALLSSHPEQAQRLLATWMQAFPERFYLELQRTGREGDEAYVKAAVVLAGQAQCPVVATNDVRFMQADDFESHEARVCIGEGVTLDDPRRTRRYTDQQYFTSAEEMEARFSDIPSAIENTYLIAQRCSVEVQLGTYYLPEYPIPEGLTQEQFFRQISFQGLEERLEKILDKNAADYSEKRQVYLDRLNFELDIIIQMGFPGYFLIVMDFIQWAKSQDIPVGPGRGSGAGSLVAYAQKITDLDPLQYDLLFERFLNPERVSMPDFDIDFCMDNRDQVIHYVAERYGRQAVSQIVTFGTMAAKAVVRDVARVQGKSYGLADKLSKLIPADPGMTLNKALEEETALKEFLDQDEEAQEIWEMALKLEGITRGTGKHAGGVVIAPTKLTDFSPVLCEEDGTGLVTQFDKNDVEEAGLVKFDFLGLRTLTIIDRAVSTVNELRVAAGEPLLKIEDIPLQDPAAFALLKQAKTTAVFQLESRGMKDLVKRLQPDCLEDMIALVALFRPGPLQSGMVDDFINRKHGRAELAYPHPDYQHDDLIPILQPTYGIILYQEQVMQIAQVLACYTLGAADLLRRAMGKKKPEEMAKQRQIFMDGAKGRGIGEDLAANIFDLMEKFAGYGFNKSHSAAYALVSYQTLWLKTHYPAPFMAAVLTSDMQNTDKVVGFLEDCRSLGINVELPDVNQGEFGFTVNQEGNIIYGLGAVKGVGEGPIEAIVSARKTKGGFRDLFDFCQRVEKGKLNKRVLESLVRCGAFDRIGPNRATLMACIEPALRQADQHAQNLMAGMTDLFGSLADTAPTDAYAEYPFCQEWPAKERLKGEKETLGLYVSGHPFDEYEAELRRLAKTPIQELKPSRKNQKVAGLIVNQRLKKSKRGDTLAFLTVDDRSGRLDVSLFGEVYDANRDWIAPDKVVLMEGEVSHDDYSGMLKMRVKSITPIEAVRVAYAQAIDLILDGRHLKEDYQTMLQQSFQQTSSQGCPVVIHYRNQNARVSLSVAQEQRLVPSDETLETLKTLWGERNVRIRYA